MFPDLYIKKIYRERGSAYEPDQRSPVFAELLKDIDSGYVQGIIAWHPDRLSRNEEDAAKITYRLRKGVIRDLKFCSYNFDNSPEGIMMLQLALSQSQYFSAKLSRDVKRGIDEKLRRGWQPGLVPQGYINDRLEKTVTEDEPRLALIQRMWLLLLTGHYTPPRIVDIANREWGFRTYQRKKTGGKPLARSAIYKIFHNPFYAGYMAHNGQLFKGAHRAIITMRQFEEGQRILTTRGRVRKVISRDFAYAQVMRCGECGCLLTTQLTKGIIYYHCTRRSSTVSCSQRRMIREDTFENLLEARLTEYNILPQFYRWAVQKLDEEAEAATAERDAIHSAQDANLKALEGEMDGLIKMKARDLINDDEFIQRRDVLRSALTQATDSTRNRQTTETEHRVSMRRAFDFALRAIEILRNGDIAARRALVRSMSVSIVVENGQLTWQPAPWLIPMGRAGAGANPHNARLKAEHDALRLKNRKVQTSKNPSTKGKTAALTAAYPQWCTIVDEVKTAIAQGSPSCYIPEFDERCQLIDDLGRPDSGNSAG